MAVDISTDLIIQVNGAIQITPTANDIYDVAGVAGQYDPGRDYSRTDNVSKNGQPSYLVNISLNSATNQDYSLEKLSVGFASQSDSLVTSTQVFFINTSPNALDVADDGLNVLANGVATSPIAVFTAGLTSNSTLSTSILVTLPNETAWKTKLQPKIVVIAEKDGKIAKQTANLPPVLLAPKTRYVSVLTAPNQNVSFSQNAFKIPFEVLCAADRYPNQILPVIALTNKTDFSSATFRIDLTAKVNNIAAVLDPIGFTFLPPVGFSVVSYTFIGGVLEFMLSGPFATVPAGLVTKVFASLPYIPQADAINASVSLGGAWNGVNPVSIVANNNYQILFELAQGGSANYTSPFVDLTGGGIGALRLRHVLALNTINTPPPTFPQSIAATHDDLFYKAVGSKYVLLLDSAIAGIKPNAVAQPVQIAFTDQNGTPQVQGVNQALYSISYAYVGINSTSYNPNVISHDVVIGAIPTGTYASVIASGNKPNIRLVTLIGDPWAGVSFDAMKEHTLLLDDVAVDTMQGDEFADFYEQNPLADLTSHWYSYLSLNTTLSSVAEGNALYGVFMAPMDSFELRGSVFLNMGTLKRGAGKTVPQFNDISVVQQFAGIYPWKGLVVYGITDDFGLPVNTIADYTKKYCLRLTAAVPNGFVFAQPIMKPETPIIFPIPSALAPYFVLDGQPYISTQTGTKTPITSYSYDGLSIKFTWADVETLLGGAASGGMGGACFPIKLLPPSKTLIFQPTKPTIAPENLLLHKPEFVTDHMPSSSPFFVVSYSLPPTTLIGLAIDNTGLFVTPTVYPNGSSVKYTATVHNRSFVISDYYTINTVPTNKYNEIETSNNTKAAYINSLLKFNPLTEIFYQVESGVTPQDIAMSKVLGATPDLKTYYSQTIKATWIKWQGGALPQEVVMFATFTPAVLKEDLVRVDYEVTVQLILSEVGLHINNASFKYQSTGSGLEAHSNVTSIQNIPLAVPVSAIKSVVPTSVAPDKMTPITFTVLFTLPAFVNTNPATTINFIDNVNPAFVITSTSFSLVGGQYYTIANLSTLNLVNYKLVTAIPSGFVATIPLTAILTIKGYIKTDTPMCSRVPNQASIAVNTNTPVLSNEVFVNVGSMQSISDLIESTALMQAGISHIINAEGGKIQKAVEIGTIEQIIEINSSVEEMLESISRLEIVLAQKVGQFKCVLCCDEQPVLDGDLDVE